jgi:hypothetical protein
VKARDANAAGVGPAASVGTDEDGVVANLLREETLRQDGSARPKFAEALRERGVVTRRVAQS